MTSIQKSFAYVNARFFSLLDQVQAGTLTSVDILNSAGSAVVAKMVSKSSFDAAVALGGAPVHVVVPQLPYGMVPQRVGYNGLYQLVKQLRDDNSIVESATKAALAYTTDIAATCSLYNDGGGNGLTLTALAAGPDGNNLTFTVVAGVAESAAIVGNAVTLTLNSGVSTLTSVAATLTGTPGIPFSVAVNGVGATIAFAGGPYAFSGGDTGNVVFTALASGSLGNNLTVTMVDPLAVQASTVASIVGDDVTVTLRSNGVNVLATLAEVASVVTAASSTLRMFALAGDTTTLLAGAMPQTNLSGGIDGTGKHYIAYDVTRTFLPSRQSGLAPSAAVRAVMIPKALADQIGL